VVLVVETRERPLVLLLLLRFAFWSLWLVEVPLDVRLFKFVRLQQTARNKSSTAQTVLWIGIRNFLQDPDPGKLIPDPGNYGSEMNLK
jgi:hypothetical protein